jgi:iron complex transport system permease protein
MDYLTARLLSSFLAGALLSQAGSSVQLATRNILASPSTLGIDGLAVLWLLLIHSLALAVEGLELQLGLALGLPLCLLLALGYTRLLRREVSPERVILLGITFNLLVGAVFSLWQFYFLAFNRPFPAEVWFGHFRFAAPETALTLLWTEVILLGGLIWGRRQIQLYSLGPSVHQLFGLRRSRVFMLLFSSAIIATFVVVAGHGAFSFLGLVFPLIARKLWFRRFDLPGEFVLGAVFNGAILMAIDYICYRFPLYGAEVPVGLLMAVVGAVSLILLLWSGQKHADLLAKH